MTGYGVGFPKGSPFIDEVNKIILELQNNGKCVQCFYILKVVNKMYGCIEAKTKLNPAHLSGPIWVSEKAFSN